MFRIRVSIAILSLVVLLVGSVGGAIGSGGGSQSSSFHPDASGSHFPNGEGWESDAWGDGYESSRCPVWFDLTKDTDYTLDGWIEEFDSGFMYLSLTGPSGTVHSLNPPHNNTLFISESGFLLAGSYVLDVRSSGSAFGDEFFPDYASGAYDVTFTIPTATSAPPVAAAAEVTIAPNPFRTSTTIAWRDPGPADVTIHDPAGRLVRRLSGGDETSASWDGRSASGRRMPSGVYFVTMTTGEETRRTKLTLVR
jgi:hypothetical protein